MEMGYVLETKKDLRAMDANARRRRARLLSEADRAFRAHRTEAALGAVQAILSEDPDHIGALETLAKIQWQAADYAPLVQVLGRLLTLNPYEPGYHVLRGSALQALGKLGDAISEFSQAGAQGHEALHELQSWQADLIRDRCSRDPVFAAAIAQNAGSACRRYGFRFVDGPVDEARLQPMPASADFVVRPS